jgi:hypothetical protein
MIGTSWHGRIPRADSPSCSNLKRLPVPLHWQLASGFCLPESTDGNSPQAVTSVRKRSLVRVSTGSRSSTGNSPSDDRGSATPPPVHYAASITSSLRRRHRRASAALQVRADAGGIAQAVRTQERASAPLCVCVCQCVPVWLGRPRLCWPRVCAYCMIVLY